MSASVTPAVEDVRPVRRPVASRTWRGAAVGVVAAGGVTVVLAGAADLPGFIPYSAIAVLLATLWAVRRPGGWGAFALLVVQVLAATVPWAVPTSLVDWALAAAAATAVVTTHLSLALLAAWPVRAELPRASLDRWVRQGAVLVLVGVVAALVGALASRTPISWGPFVGTLALLLLAALAWTVRLATRRR
ncbi:hypothetical protein [Oryzobacter telluris]|uniref:hypothetical protein n=1 Tax=Oryzobacter telluris TaxID=3149179 RepID=UPI00370D62D1